MTLLAQHGYGKSDKIEIGLRNGSLEGVVLSPRDLAPPALQSYVRDLRDEFGDQIEILIDPQFFGTIIEDATERNLLEYEFYQTGLVRSDFLKAKAITTYATETLSYQASLPINRLLSPTIAFDGFAETWCQTALQLGAESLDVFGGLNTEASLLASFVISETALADTEGVDEFLNIISAWETAGFYFIVEPTQGSYPASVQPERLANLLYLTYSLSVVNGFDVYFGYSDFSGLPLRAVGASAQATGWYGGLRQFSRNRWQPSSGGRAARARYSSGKLMNSILQIPELSGAYSVGSLDLCLSGTPSDSFFAYGDPANVDWSPADQCIQHWEVLSNLSGRIVNQSTVNNRLHALRDMMSIAASNYESLLDEGVMFDRLSGPGHLRIWSEALDQLEARITL